MPASFSFVFNNTNTATRRSITLITQNPILHSAANQPIMSTEADETHPPGAEVSPESTSTRWGEGWAWRHACCCTPPPATRGLSIDR